MESLSNTIIQQVKQISISRKTELDKLAELIINSVSQKGYVNLIFVCTHNSRRSQAAELFMSLHLKWAGIKDIYTYSGGTELTALNPRIVNALIELNIPVRSFGGNKNPYYIINDLPKVFFSKKHDSPFNPHKNRIAIMVCDHADQNCPVISGADYRFSLNYIDPKRSDDTPQEKKKIKKKILK